MAFESLVLWALAPAILLASVYFGRRLERSAAKSVSRVAPVPPEIEQSAAVP